MTRLRRWLGQHGRAAVALEMVLRIVVLWLVYRAHMLGDAPLWVLLIVGVALAGYHQPRHRSRVTDHAGGRRRGRRRR